MIVAWEPDWAWGLLLVALTLVIHAFGLVAIGLALTRAEALIRSQDWRLSSVTATALLIGVVGWMLAVLHGLEAAVWAIAYLVLGAVASPADAMLYSVDSITTRGASGLSLQPHWRLMGALEAANGMLLFGISTAFLFAVLERVWLRFSPPDSDQTR